MSNVYHVSMHSQSASVHVCEPNLYSDYYIIYQWRIQGWCLGCLCTTLNCKLLTTHILELLEERMLK